MNPIPTKVYVIIAALLAAVVGLALFAWRERELGAQAIREANIRVADARKIHDVEVQDAAQAQITAAVTQFQADHAAPPPAAPAIVCSAAAPRPYAVPDHAAPAGAGNGAPAVPAESDGPPHASFDPAPAVVQDGRDADDQVKLLQAYILACQTQGMCRKK